MLKPKTHRHRNTYVRWNNVTSFSKLPIQYLYQSTSPWSDILKNAE